MMDKMTHEDLLRLTSVQDGPCISIYMPALPSKTLQIEYDALVRRAQHLLTHDKREELRHELMENLYNFNPHEYMSSQEKGLAVFVNKHWHSYFPVTHDLPSKVVVADSFHLKPLLEDLQKEHVFNILVLTAHECVFFNCDGDKAAESHTFLHHQGQHSNSIHWKFQDKNEDVQIPHLKSQLRGRGQQDSQFKKKSSVKLFLRWIETKINKEAGYKTLPLYVFTSDALFLAYKEISTHPAPSIIPIDASKGLPRTEALLHQANAQIQKNSMKHKSVSTAEMNELSSQKKVVDDILKISKAALGGKIKTLFLRDNIEIWGQLHRASGQMTMHEKQMDSKDDDILDDIACEVIRHGGEVMVLTTKDMPTGSPIAAILN